MNKLLAVLKREYVQAVRKKMFIVMTFLLPFLMVGLFIVPALLMSRGLGDKHVIVLDATGQLREAFTGPKTPEQQSSDPFAKRNSIPQSVRIEYVDRSGDANLDETAKPYLARLSKEDKKEQLDAVLLVPKDALTSTDEKTHLTFYSRTAADVVTEDRVTSMANKGIHRYRLSTHGITGDAVDNLLRDVPVNAVQFTRTGEQKKGGGTNLIIAFVFAGMLILPSFMYGTEIMRGIVQEKMDRIVEILVSSMKPMQLLSGKILGIATVGLTQVGVWVTMGMIANARGLTKGQAMAEFNIAQFLKPAVFVAFVAFFILAYLTYVCIYAVAGAICNSDKEAQQLIAPISMIMMVPWFLMPAIITNPDSTLVTSLSLAPVFGPVTMFVRTLVTEPPLWQLAASIGISVATVIVFFWGTAKIFRIGILSYGKRPSLAELWRWMKVA